MRPAKPQRDVIGHAHCYKLTHSVAFVRAVAYEDDPADPIAAAQAAFMLTGAPSFAKATEGRPSDQPENLSSEAPTGA
jgi:hypothetical protein